jgi:hypothetical protein
MRDSSGNRFLVFYYDPQTNLWAFGKKTAVTAFNEDLNWKKIEEHPKRAQRLLFAAAIADPMQNVKNQSFMITRSNNFPNLRLLWFFDTYVFALWKKK